MQGHMDGYFKRIKRLMRRDSICFRMRFMLQDVIELRERSWQAREGRASVEQNVSIEPQMESGKGGGVEENGRASIVVEENGIQEAIKTNAEVPVKAPFEIGSVGASEVEIGVAHISAIRPDLHTHQIPSLTIRPPLQPQSTPPQLPRTTPKRTGATSTGGTLPGQQSQLEAGRRDMSGNQKRAVMVQAVKSLLSTLTAKRLHLVSERIIEWANKNEQEAGAHALGRVTSLVCSKARSEPTFSKLCAGLCQKMMGRILPDAQDETIRNVEGQLVTGVELFRRYLSNACQLDFEGQWPITRRELAGQGIDEAENNNYPSLGMVRFVGELFKLGLFKERIMHECMKVLLTRGVNSDDQTIEKLCTLMMMVGESLDTVQARDHMDLYFERMQTMAESISIEPGMQGKLQDIIELRARKWQARPQSNSTRGDSARGGSPVITPMAKSGAGALGAIGEDIQGDLTRRPDEPDSQEGQIEPGEIAGPEARRLSREEKGKGRVKVIGEPEEKERGKEEQEDARWGRAESEFQVEDAGLQATTGGAETGGELGTGGRITARVVDAATEVRGAGLPAGLSESNLDGILPRAVSKHPSLLSNPTTAREQPKPPVASTLDSTYTQLKRSVTPPSALASARAIQDLSTVPYPEAIKRLDPELNIGATPGKFRYSRDFLLQFMNVCKKRPDSLVPLDAIGLDPNTAPSPPISKRAAKRNANAVGLGPGNVSPANGGFSMDSVQAPPSPGFVAPKLGERTHPSGNTERNLPPGEARTLVDQSFKPLLDSLTAENSSWTFSQITEWMSKSEEKPGASELKYVVKLICEKAQMEEGFSKTCAILLQKMMKHVSPTMQDEAIRNPAGEPIVGSALFQRYMLIRCQEEFRRWESTKQGIGAPKARKNLARESVGGEAKESDEENLQGDEDDALAKSRRQWLGAVRFIGELFKLRLLTARIMHVFLMKLLSSAEEQTVEGLSTLMKIAGPILERLKSWNYMDVYFNRIQETMEGSDTSSKVKLMLRVSRWYTSEKFGH
ncbi:ARM repeat-containing protein [Ceratobasidium sp. AG-I]|nr:ARM repeat-containing protein [Ceratobasidium sp. AG-I]